MKKNWTLSIEDTVMIRFKELLGSENNTSQQVEDLMSNYLKAKQSTESDIDILMLKNKLNELILNKSNLAAMEISLRQQIRMIEDGIKIGEAKKLEDDKAKLFELTRCANCKSALNERDLDKYKANIGNICKACFIGATKEQSKLWFKS